MEQTPRLVWSIPQGAEEMWTATSAGILLFPLDLALSKEVRLHGWDEGELRWSVDLGPEAEGYRQLRVQPNFKDGHVGLLLEAEDREPRLVVLRTSDGSVERGQTVPSGRYHELASGAVYRLLAHEEGTVVARYTSVADLSPEWETTLQSLGGAELLLTEQESRLEICAATEWNSYSHGCWASLDLDTGRQAAWLSDGNSFQRFGEMVVVSDPMLGKVRGIVGNQERWSRDLRWATLWSAQGTLLVTSEESLFRLEPRTGEEKWRSALGAEPPVITSAGNEVILIENRPTLRTAVLDQETGGFTFQDHGVPASGHHEVTEKGWIISVHAADAWNGVTLRALDPTRAAPVWEVTFPDHFWASNLHGHLLLQGGDTLGVAR